jgi:tryptophan 2,3-dioxygenase
MSDPQDMTYARYLALDELLSAQHPVSDEHDELLFIVIHQTKELWLKQALAEIDLAIGLVRQDALTEAYKSLARVSRIQAVMTLSWDVLTTMTPSDYSTFRPVLGSSSGFQSDQFRTMEFRLGLKNADYLAHQSGRDHALERMRAALEAPSLWDEANMALHRNGVELPRDVTERDWSEPYQARPEVEAAWLEVYRDTRRHWALYQLAEKLVDVDDALAAWRHKHVLTVSRVIGAKRGTGGTAGVPYLQSTLSKRAFPELWNLRTSL